jgi:hypothetical protein
MAGIAAVIQAATYVAGIALYFTLLAAPIAEGVDPVQRVAVLARNQAITYTSNLIIYVLSGVALVVLALALYERLKARSPAMAQTATAFGLIWAGLVIAAGMVFNVGLGTVVDIYGKDPAQAATIWLAINSVFDGLERANVIVGGLWTCAVSWAALRAEDFPKTLNYLGVVIGGAGILSTLPALEVLVFVFGLGGIVWVAWLAIVLLRGSRSAAAAERWADYGDAG